MLTKDERSFKQRVDRQWAENAYRGLVDAPLVRALNGFIETTQEKVTGTVTIKLEGSRARPVGRDSEYAGYSASAASFNTETVDGIAQEDATGVAKYHGFQGRLANAVRDRALKQASEEPVADGGVGSGESTADDR